MTTEQLQKVVDAENKRLNEIAEGKALARLREIRALIDEKNRIDKQILSLQKEVSEIPFDVVTAEDVVNGFGPTA